MTSHPLRVLCSGLLLTATIACDPEVPAELRYHLIVESGSSVSGARILLDGEPIGELTLASLDFTTPSSVRPSALTTGLVLRLPTLCGHQDFPLAPTFPGNADSDEWVATWMAQDDHQIRVYAELAEGSGVPHQLFIDWGDQATTSLQIGEIEIEPNSGSKVTIFAAGCDSSVPVRLGDGVIGTWITSAESTFISVASNICHRVETVSYGVGSVGAANPTIFGQRVRALEHTPDFFLTPPRGEIESDGNEAYRYSLNRSECPSNDRPWAIVGAELAEAQRCGEAIFVLRRATGFDNGDTTSWAHLVGCLAVSERGSEALDDARSSLRYNPTSQGLRATLVTRLRDAGRSAEADALESEEAL